MSRKLTKKPNRRIALPVSPGAALLIVGGLLLLGLVVAAIWNSVASASGTGGGQPSLNVDTEKIDLGKVPLGQSVHAAFTLTNTGDAPLHLSQAPYIQVVDGCCAPEPSIGSMMLQPGESTEVSMEFMMHEGMGGLHDFRLHLVTNDPAQPDRVLTVLSNWVE